EDGIRDGHVTGVQTCALPIWIGRRRRVGRRFDVRSRQSLLFLLQRRPCGPCTQTGGLAPLLRGATGPGRALLVAPTGAGREWHEIGRASCRERGWACVRTGAV